MRKMTLRLPLGHAVAGEHDTAASPTAAHNAGDGGSVPRRASRTALPPELRPQVYRHCDASLLATIFEAIRFDPFEELRAASELPPSERRKFLREHPALGARAIPRKRFDRASFERTLGDAAKMKRLANLAACARWDHHHLERRESERSSVQWLFEECLLWLRAVDAPDFAGQPDEKALASRRSRAMAQVVERLCEACFDGGHAHETEERLARQRNAPYYHRLIRYAIQCADANPNHDRIVPFLANQSEEFAESSEGAACERALRRVLLLTDPNTASSATAASAALWRLVSVSIPRTDALGQSCDVATLLSRTAELNKAGLLTGIHTPRLYLELCKAVGTAGLWSRAEDAMNALTLTGSVATEAPTGTLTSWQQHEALNAILQVAEHYPRHDVIQRSLEAFDCAFERHAPSDSEHRGRLMDELAQHAARPEWSLQNRDTAVSLLEKRMTDEPWHISNPGWFVHLPSLLDSLGQPVEQAAVPVANRIRKLHNRLLDEVRQSLESGD